MSSILSWADSNWVSSSLCLFPTSLPYLLEKKAHDNLWEGERGRMEILTNVSMLPSELKVPCLSPARDTTNPRFRKSYKTFSSTIWQAISCNLLSVGGYIISFKCKTTYGKSNIHMWKYVSMKTICSWNDEIWITTI